MMSSQLLSSLKNCCTLESEYEWERQLTLSIVIKIILTSLTLWNGLVYPWPGGKCYKLWRIINSGFIFWIYSGKLKFWLITHFLDSLPSPEVFNPYSEAAWIDEGNLRLWQLRRYLFQGITNIYLTRMVTQGKE